MIKNRKPQVNSVSWKKQRMEYKHLRIKNATMQTLLHFVLGALHETLLRLIRKTTFCTTLQKHNKKLIYDGFLNLFWSFFSHGPLCMLIKHDVTLKATVLHPCYLSCLGLPEFLESGCLRADIMCRIQLVGMSLCLIHRVFMAVRWISLFFGFRLTNSGIERWCKNSWLYVSVGCFRLEIQMWSEHFKVIDTKCTQSNFPLKLLDHIKNSHLMWQRERMFQRGFSPLSLKFKWSHHIKFDLSFEIIETILELVSWCKCWMFLVSDSNWEKIFLFEFLLYSKWPFNCS